MTTITHSVHALRAQFSDHIRRDLPYLELPLRGRDDDLARILAILRDGNCVQLTAPSGWGKSRLAAEIALQYPQGAIWHRFSATSGIREIFATVRRHFDMNDTISYRSLTNLIKKHRPLVVLDNLESIHGFATHWYDYVDWIFGLIEAKVPLLVTSNVFLGSLSHDTRYLLEPLSDDAGFHIVNDFATHQQINLTASQQIELSRLAQNHPGTIELAVRWLKHQYPYEKLVKQLTQSTERKTSRFHDVMYRYIEQIEEQAPDGDKAVALLRHLTLMRGTFSSEAISALKPDNLSDAELQKAIHILRRYTLLHHDKSSGRYWLDQTLNQTLWADNLTSYQPIFLKYAEFYIERATAIRVEAKRRFDLWTEHPDFANIRHVGNMLISRSKIQYEENEDLDEDDEGYYTAIMPQAEYTLLAMRFAESIGEYTRYYEQNDFHKWLDMGILAVKLWRDSDPDDAELKKIHATFLRYLTNYWLRWNSIEHARKACDESLALYQTIDDAYGKAQTMEYMGLIHQRLNNVDMAIHYLDQAHSVYETRGDDYRLLEIYLAYSLIWSTQKEHQKGFEASQKGLKYSQKLGYKLYEAECLLDSALHRMRLTDLQGALQDINNALRLARELAYQELEAQALMKLGIFYSDPTILNHQKALDYYEQALALAQKIGYDRIMSQLYHNIGVTYKLLREYDKALFYYEQSLAIARKSNDDNKIITLIELCNIHRYKREYDKTIAYLEEAIKAYPPDSPMVDIWKKGIQSLQKRKKLRFIMEPLRLFIFFIALIIFFIPILIRAMYKSLTSPEKSGGNPPYYKL